MPIHPSSDLIQNTRRGYPGILLILAILIFSLLGGCKSTNLTPDLAQPVVLATQTGAPLTPASNDAEDIRIIAQTLVEQMANGDFEAATSHFDATMRKALPESKFKEIWQQLTAQVGAYEKQLDTKQDELQGYRRVHVISQFEKADIDVLVVFDSQDEIAGLFFNPAEESDSTPQSYQVPEYVDSSAFEEMEVTIGEGTWALPGTLTLPRGEGPFPALVLVHGSGPNDQDETIGPNKPFRDLAWGLASQGIAVLRYDKRTLTYADQFTPEILTGLTVQDETITDALLAAQLLRQTEKVAAQRIFVAGHSLGGMLIPRIGQQDPSLAGLVALAGPTRPLEDLILDQVTYLSNMDGVLTDQEAGELATIQAQVARVKDPNLSKDTLATDLPLGIPPTYWLDLRGYQPAEVAKTLAQPLLILQGGRDYQVQAAKDYQGWKDSLAGQAEVTFHLYPDLNHLFITGEEPSTPAEYQNEGHVSLAVIADIAAWIKDH